MQNVLVHKLSSLINETKVNKDFTMTKLETILREFRCERNTGITDFISKSAINSQKADVSNTYLILDDKRNKLRAFFTLVQKDIDISLYGLKADPLGEEDSVSKFIEEDAKLKPKDKKTISKTAKQKLTGSKKFTKVSSIHIAQFAKSDIHEIQGSIIWQSFYGVMANWESPHRVFTLDCKKEMISYYTRYGFKVLGHNNLLKRYIMIKKKDTARYNN